MYEAFYGLRERPFNLTPDPRFLYLSEKHKEAFAHLLYGIKNRSGFVMISGEIGTGKTTLCRNLLNQLDAGTELAFIFNPFLNPIELMKKINQEFGITSTADTILGLTEELNVHLLHSAAHGKNCVLVIDEAQNLAPQVLEQIRLLSNLETDSEKLLQIILIGQPELAEKLTLRELRQLNQRITARYHLKALDAQETVQYIAYRLHIAGGRKRLNFTKGAARLIYKLSGGVPRMINAITDRALLIGYTKEQHVISAGIVRKASREIRGEKVTAPKEPRLRWRRLLPSPSAVVLVILALILAGYLATPLNRFAHELNVFNRILSGDLTASNANEPERSDAAATSEEDGNHNGALNTALPVETPGALQMVMERLNTVSATRPSQSLSHILAELNAQDALQASLDTLVSLWNNSPTDPAYPDINNTEEIVAFFEVHNLACEHLQPTIEQLFNFNLPGMVRIVAGENNFWIGILRADDNTVTLQTDRNRRVTVALSEFAIYYGRELLVAWEDPKPEAPVLIQGQRGAQVRALKQQLRALDLLNADNTSDVYDQETRNAVMALQSEAGLNTDGKAGRQVRLALTSRSGDAPTLRRDANRRASQKTSIPRLNTSPVGTISTASRDRADTRPEQSEHAPASRLNDTAHPPPAPDEQDLPFQSTETSTISVYAEPVTTPVLTTPVAPSDTASPPPAQEKRLLRLLRENWEDQQESPDDTGISNGGLTDVRELADPFTPEPATQPEPQSYPDVTAPVYGSAPLVPHTEERL